MAQIALTGDLDTVVEVVVKLIELTQKRRLLWRVATPEVAFRGEPPMEVLEAEYKGNVLRLSTRREAHGNGSGRVGPLWGRVRERPIEGVSLDVIDPASGRSVWIVPRIPALRELWTEAEQQASGQVTQFIQSVLSEE